MRYNRRKLVMNKISSIRIGTQNRKVAKEIADAIAVISKTWPIKWTNGKYRFLMDGTSVRASKEIVVTVNVFLVQKDIGKFILLILKMIEAVAHSLKLKIHGEVSSVVVGTH